MRMLSDSWCFCNGGGKSERLKANIFSTKSSAMARISSSAASSAFSSGGGTGDGGGGREVVGSGFLIHRNLLLTTHVSLPSASAAESAEIRLQNAALATLVPHRFFITSSVLDLTIVGLDYIEGESNTHGHQAHYLKTCSKPNLDLGSIVYVLGYTEKKEPTVSEGKVVISTDNLIKLNTDGVILPPGSAGFDSHGNPAFIICDPMKLATSSSTSTTSSSSKKDLSMQFGIPMPVICDWLNQHWEGSLDEHSKPKLPLMRLVSGGQKSDHRCASFTMRQIFKPNDPEADVTASSSSIMVSKPQNLARTHAQGILTPELFESPKVTAVPVKKREIPVLDINFPTKVAESPNPANAEVSSTGSVNGGQSEVQSSSSPVADSDARDGQSEVETMYSAETAESRNYTSPREAKFTQSVGRSQSCVNYNRWAVHKYPVNQRSSNQQRKTTYSHVVSSNRSNDLFSPTVSSVMKKRNNLEQRVTPVRARQTVMTSSQRWMF